MINPSSKYSFEECLLGSVIAINISNSTHLETTKNGRKYMARRIFEKCSSLEELIKELDIKFDSNNENHLLSCMLKPGLKSIKHNDDMYYLSFASKFCSYASSFFNTIFQYSKYDSVVADALP